VLTLAEGKEPRSTYPLLIGRERICCIFKQHEEIEMKLTYNYIYSFPFFISIIKMFLKKLLITYLDDNQVIQVGY
jgi:hypothetical protein